MANGGIIGPVNDPTTTTVVTPFTASGTFNPSNQATPGQVDYLVISRWRRWRRYLQQVVVKFTAGGGGGAGGFRTGTCFPGGTKFLLVSGSYPVTVRSRWSRRFRTLV
jgi:hypothetical protein